MRNQTATRPALRRNSSPIAAGRPVRRSTPRIPEMAFGLGDLLALRAWVTGYASELGADDRLDDVVLVVHELATNVVRHGGGHGRLGLWREDDQIICRMTDSGPGLPDAETTGTVPPPHGVAGGRGLFIARRLSVVRIDTSPDGTTITAALPLPR